MERIFLDLCDEQGILVWKENHARGLSLEDMKNSNFEIQAEQVLSMVTVMLTNPSGQRSIRQRHWKNVLVQ